MDVYRTEEEQVAAIRNWWQQNGIAVLVAIVLAALTYAGWHWYKQTRAEEALAASSLYQGMMESFQQMVQGGQAAADAEARIVKAGDELINKYGDSIYAQFAALMLAGHAVEQDDYAGAEKYLRTALNHDGDKSLTALTTNRLARVLSAQGKHDEALALLQGEVPAKFVAAREDVRGDVLLAQGKRAAARAAWQKALDSTPEDDAARGLLTMKLDYVAGE